MREPITIIVPIHVKPEYRDQIRDRLNYLAAKTSQEAGSVFYILHEITNQPDSFVIYEKWADQEALDFHMKQDYLLHFLEDSIRMLSKEIAGMICREI